MQDNALIALVRGALIAGEAVAGIANTPIKQAFQPIADGANSVPTAYFYKIGDKRIGYVDIADSSNGVSNTHTETQQYETTFQISALATQDPTQPGLTASDILNLMAAIMQGQVFISTIQAASVGITKIGDVRNPYFTDEKQRFEAMPSFDYTLTHKQIITSTSPVISQLAAQIIPV